MFSHSHGCLPAGTQMEFSMRGHRHRHLVSCDPMVFGKLRMVLLPMAPHNVTPLPSANSEWSYSAHGTTCIRDRDLDMASVRAFRPSTTHSSGARTSVTDGPCTTPPQPCLSPQFAWGGLPTYGFNHLVGFCASQGLRHRQTVHGLHVFPRRASCS